MYLAALGTLYMIDVDGGDSNDNNGGGEKLHISLKSYSLSCTVYSFYFSYQPYFSHGT